MALKGKPIAIGTSATTIYTCPAGVESAVHGLIFSNNSASPLVVTVQVFNQADNTTTTVATNLSVPANSYITWTKPVNMNAGDTISALASASGIVCLFSVYEGSAAPVAIGFTGRGIWASGSSYSTNDIVTVAGSGTYLALQASTNQNPTTATSFWMFLEGISASALPAQSGQAGRFLTTDGTNASWAVVNVAGGATSSLNRSSNLTLTSSSDRVQKLSFAGSGYTVFLPNATTLPEGGALFVIENKGDFTFSVLTSGSLPATSVGPGSLMQLYLVDNTSANGIWQIQTGSAQGSFASAQSVVVDDTKVLSQGHMAQIADSKFIAVYWDSTDANNMYLRVVDMSGINPVLGTRVSFTLTQSTGPWDPNPAIAQLTADTAVLMYMNRTGGAAVEYLARVLTVSGTTITVGNTATIASYGSAVDSYWGNQVLVMSPTSVVFGWSPYVSTTWTQRIRAATISGTSFTFGTETNMSGSWPGLHLVRESSTQFTAWNTDANSYFPDQVRRFTLSGTTFTQVRTDTVLQYYPGTFYHNGPRTVFRDANALYMVNNPSASANLVLQKYVPDPANGNRWSRITGYRSITASNSLASAAYTISLYSNTGGVTRIACLNYGSAGLSGAGMLLSFFIDDANTNSLYQSSLSFIISGEGTNALVNSTRNTNSENVLIRNTAGDLFTGYRDLISQRFVITKIGLAAV